MLLLLVNYIYAVHLYNLIANLAPLLGAPKGGAKKLLTPPLTFISAIRPWQLYNLNLLCAMYSGHPFDTVKVRLQTMKPVFCYVTG